MKGARTPVPDSVVETEAPAGPQSESITAVRLGKILADPRNQVCADCLAPHPTWAVTVKAQPGLLAHGKQRQQHPRLQQRLDRKTERSFIMIKPDGVQRGLIGRIVMRFEAKGFQMQALRQITPSRDHLEKHYADLSSKSFFTALIDYMMSSPVVAMVWAGDGVVEEGRKMLGATRPSESAMGTIRGDYCIDIGRNVCHGSDSVDSAEREIALWFPETNLGDWSHHSAPWISEAEQAGRVKRSGGGENGGDESADTDANAGTAATMAGFVCLACSGVHRSLGVHISFVQSATMDTVSWTEETLNLFESWNNTRLNNVLEFHTDPRVFLHRPAPHSARDERERYVRAKYASRQFISAHAPVDADGRPIRLPPRTWSGASCACDTGAEDTPSSPSGTESAEVAAQGAKPMVGLVQVRAISGRGLPARDVGGSSDPYVRVSIGAQVAREPREVCSDTLDPNWNWSALVSWNGTDVLKFEVWDSDGALAGEDDFMGEVCVDLRGIPAAQQPAPYVPHPAAVYTLDAPLQPRGAAPTPWQQLVLGAANSRLRRRSRNLLDTRLRNCAGGTLAPASGATGYGSVADDGDNRPNAGSCCACVKRVMHNCATFFGTAGVSGQVRFSVAFMLIE